MLLPTFRYDLDCCMTMISKGPRLQISFFFLFNGWYLIVRYPDNENDGITYLRDNKGNGTKVWRKILK